jgi:beta-glucosidase
MESAIEKGVDVWHDGYGPRFGIVYVDYDTMERLPKDSALWLREVMGRTRDRTR